MAEKVAQAFVEDSRDWTRILAPYCETNVSRSVFELLVTAAPFVMFWALMWASLAVGYWLCLLLAVPTAAFLTRLFMIQHDCGHGALFRRRATNDWVGRIIGVATLTPYSFWLRTHAGHHANAGNIDHRGMGDIITLTTDEYRALPLWSRAVYRLYRNPIVMFGVIPSYLFCTTASRSVSCAPGGGPGSARWERTRRSREQRQQWSGSSVPNHSFSCTARSC